MISKADCGRNALDYIEDQVRPWVDLIDRLRAVGIEQDLDIPQIAVMGDQSSGKSSVLEAISGVQFPRGTGLVTRCATELRMKKKKDSPWTARISLTWNEAQPSDAGLVDSPEQLGQKITKLTEILLLARGKNATFEPEHSILIELTSADVPDLTIIDLPGIVRTTLEGQSKTVVAEVDSLLQKYLAQERTVILAVIPSNVDLATVDIIERANQADPNGNRTVGVLTKPDMIAEGCEGEKVDTLMNVTKPLKLGYIMVKNRSQKQIEDGMSLADAKVSEVAWFRSHAHFAKMDSSLFGVDNLAKKLTDILVHRIKESVPQLHKEVSSLLEKTRVELNQLGTPPPQTTEQMKSMMVNISQMLVKEIESAIGGSYDTMLLSKEKNAKLRIYARFREHAVIFKDSVLKQKPSRSVEQLQKIIAEMQGRELPGFTKPAVMEFLVRDFVQQWEDLLLELLNCTKSVVLDACAEIVEHHIPTHRRMISAMRTTIQEIVMTRTDVARGTLMELIRNEQSPMTMNHYFMDTYNKIRMEAFEKVLVDCFAYDDSYANVKARVLSSYKQLHTIGQQSNEQYEAENLQALVDAYWKTASKRFIDNAIQSIDAVLLQKLHEQAMKNFVLLSEASDKLADFFAEEQHLKELRGRLAAKFQRLKDAQKLLADI